jgi:hypothetical protein
MNFKLRIVLLAMLLVAMLPVSSARMQATLHTAGSSMRVALPNSGAPAPIFGELVTDWNKPVKLNGVEVVSGTTIASGAQIETPEGVGAAVILKYKGRIEIAPKTNLIVTLNETSVVVNLLDGCVTLTTYGGITGAINIPQGKTLTVGPEKAGYIDVCNGKRGGSVPIVDYTICTGCPAGQVPVLAGGSFSPLLFAVGGAGAAGVIAVTSSAGHTDSLSSFTPNP